MAKALGTDPFHVIKTNKRFAAPVIEVRTGVSIKVAIGGYVLTVIRWKLYCKQYQLGLD